MPHSYDVVVVGGGIFGITTAIELVQRGHSTALLDPGPLPHPLAGSTDISKVVRLEYGGDEDYMALAEEAREGWLRWNGELGLELYHEIGVLVMTREPMSQDDFAHDSFALLRKRGHQPERLDGDEIVKRFPCWRPGVYVDGFYHAKGGYAESGRVVAALARRAAECGVKMHAGQSVHALLGDESRVTGVATREGETFSAARVVVAAGAWTPQLVPELAPGMHSTGQPVFHLLPARGEPFQTPNFALFIADIANSGWYGLPVHPDGGVIKIANHGAGIGLDPNRDDRSVSAADTERLRNFLRGSLPDLAEAPIVATRYCCYCDTLDGHFFVGCHPQRQGLCVASGGSGHGFKFAPILGQLIADAILGVANPRLARFRWRQYEPGARSHEAARYHG